MSLNEFTNHGSSPIEMTSNTSSNIQPLESNLYFYGTPWYKSINYMVSENLRNYGKDQNHLQFPDKSCPPTVIRNVVNGSALKSALRDK